MNKIILSIILCFLSGNVFASPEDDLVNFFKRTVAEEHACSNLGDFLAVSLKYITKEKLDDYMKHKAQIDQMPQGFKDSMFKMMKSAQFKMEDFQLKNVHIDGDNATIEYGVKGWPKFEGLANLKKEDGQWKVDSGKEQGSPPTAEDKKAGVAMLKEMSKAMKNAGQISKDQGTKNVTAAFGKLADAVADQALKTDQEKSLVPSSLVKVFLKNGKVFEGHLIEKTADHVRIDFQGVGITYYNDEIDRVEASQKTN